MSNVAFRVYFVELEHEGDFIYSKHGDYRIAGTLIEAEGCTSLKEVCKRVCEQHLQIKDYRDLLSALNSNSWSRLKKYVTWKMDDSEDGNWGDEFTWKNTYENELRARHEAIKDIFMGIVRGYNATVKMLEHGQINAEEL